MKKKILMFVVILISTLSCNSKKEAERPISNKSTSENLISGNTRFIDEQSIHPHQNKKTVLDNQESQHPSAVILTCSDSRVSPEIIFDQGIGDLFVIRNAGNLVTDVDMGSVEYGVEHLGVKTVVVLGHTECGAITAYVEDKNNNYKKHLSHIDDIVETIANEKEQKEITKENNLAACILANINHSVKLIEDNHIVKENNVKVVPMEYDVHTGKVIEL